MSDLKTFALPDVGEGLTEAEILSWKVKPGDTVTVNQTIVEIETAKSLVELPSPYAGTVQALHVPEGETVPVGTPTAAASAGAMSSSRSTSPSGAASPLPHSGASPFLPCASSSTPPDPGRRSIFSLPVDRRLFLCLQLLTTNCRRRADRAIGQTLI